MKLLTEFTTLAASGDDRGELCWRRIGRKRPDRGRGFVDRRLDGGRFAWKVALG
jgi:hypothetical protein